MNEWLVQLGLQDWKPALKALVMPPVPWLLLAALGAVLAPRRPRLARVLVLFAVATLWLLACPGTGNLLIRGLNPTPPPLSPEQIRALARTPNTAILVLGGGRKVLAPEYHGPDLRPLTLERLRYGQWLARQTGLPLGFSGGVGHSASGGPSEAEAVRLANQRDAGVPLRWLEDRARDTDENARFSVALLQADGIRRIVLVTHGFHQARALAAFQRATDRTGKPLVLVPASMGVPTPVGLAWNDWVPTPEGLQSSSWALHEWLGRLAGA